MPLVHDDLDTVYPRSSDPFYIVTIYIKWVKTSWTYSTTVMWIGIKNVGPRIRIFLNMVIFKSGKNYDLGNKNYFHDFKYLVEKKNNSMWY